MKNASSQALAERMKIQLDYEELTHCMRCGFCQPACPTFKETGLEAASPRGRIALMKAVVDGIYEPDQAFNDQMNLCLGCRACEPVCPADVKYGHLIEQTRNAIEADKPHGPLVKMLRNAAFKKLFPHQNRMRKLGGTLRFYQRSGLRRIVRKTGVLKLMPERFGQMEAILPEASSKGVVERLGTFVPAEGEKIATVGMFRGCIMDVLFADTNANTVSMLSKAGFEVAIPETQACCGALHAHSGELNQAKELAKRNIRAFQAAGVDYIVSNAGGCGALLIEYDHLLKDDPEFAGDAKWFAERVIDISEILVSCGRLNAVLPNSREAGKSAHAQQPQASAAQAEQSAEKVNQSAQEAIAVTYQDSCHLRNGMKTSKAPRKLLTALPGVQFREMQGADSCCGSAGIYNLVQPDMSMDILDHKMEHVRDTETSYIVTSNPGCLLQMKLGIEREKLTDKMEAVHLVDFLHARLNSSKHSL